MKTPFRFSFTPAKLAKGKPPGDTFRALFANDDENGGVWLNKDPVPIRWGKGDLIEVEYQTGRLRYLGPPRAAPGWRWALRAAVCAAFFALGVLCGGCGDTGPLDEQADAGGPDACYQVGGVCTVALPPTEPPPTPCLDCDGGIDAELTATHPPLPPVQACVPVCLDGGV